MANCPKVGTLPQDYSSKLPRGVPPVERAPTSLFPYQVIGPADTTWYFPIDLPGTNPTGVFIPQGFAYGSQVDVILFFHGNKRGEFSTVNQYWGSAFPYKVTLREDLNAAGKSALLVVPTMGSAPGHALTGNPDLGIFGKPGGAECFLAHVMQWLGTYDPHYSLNKAKVIPQVRNVVLAGHSGGGSPIHIQMESLKAKVCEIWCFDVVYYTLSDWMAFAVYNPTKRLTFYHAVQSLNALRELKKLKELTEMGLHRALDNMQIIDAGKHHYPALTNNFRNQVKTSKCLPSR
jgi:hypothetical protein